jgi:uncharacterized membrane protein
MNKTPSGTTQKILIIICAFWVLIFLNVLTQEIEIVNKVVWACYGLVMGYYIIFAKNNQQKEKAKTMNTERYGVTALFAVPFSGIGLFCIYLSVHATDQYGLDFHNAIMYGFVAVGIMFIVVGLFTGWLISKAGTSSAEQTESKQA